MYAAPGTTSNPREATTTDRYPDWDPENRCGRYILDDHGVPVPCPDLFKWAQWTEQSYKTGVRRVARDELAYGHFVSTVFLGLDHNIDRVIDPEGGHRPLLYETMAFNDYGSLDVPWNGERYSTREEALEGHAAALTELKLYLQTEVPHEQQ